MNSFFSGFEKQARAFAPRIKRILSGKKPPQPAAENVINYAKMNAEDAAKRAKKLGAGKAKTIDYRNL